MSYTTPATAIRYQQEEKETKSPWTTLIKEKIIRCHGLEEGKEWGHVEICPISEEYGNESKSYRALQDVFQSQFVAGISIDTGFQVTPHLPASSAHDIKKGNFAPLSGVLVMIPVMWDYSL